MQEGRNFSSRIQLIGQWLLCRRRLQGRKGCVHKSFFKIRFQSPLSAGKPALMVMGVVHVHYGVGGSRCFSSVLFSYHDILIVLSFENILCTICLQFQKDISILKTQVYNIAQYSMTAHLFGLNFCLFIQIVFF